MQDLNEQTLAKAPDQSRVRRTGQTMAKGRQGQVRTVSNSGGGHGDDVARNDVTACGIEV